MTSQSERATLSIRAPQIPPTAAETAGSVHRRENRRVNRPAGPQLRAFCRSELYPLLRRINSYLMRWLMNKYKRYRTWKKAIRAWTEAAGTWPRYFARWAWVKPARQMTRTTGAV